MFQLASLFIICVLFQLCHGVFFFNLNPTSILWSLQNQFRQPQSGRTECRGLERRNTVLVGFAESVIDAISDVDCHNLCVKENNFKCRSVLFYPSERSLNCVLNSDSHKTQPDNFATTSDDVIYMHNGCSSPPTQSGTCRGLEQEQKLLVGFAEQVESVGDVSECLQKCIDESELGTMEESQNCLLNSESHKTQPDMFADALEEKVTYIENAC